MGKRTQGSTSRREDERGLGTVASVAPFEYGGFLRIARVRKGLLDILSILMGSGVWVTRYYVSGARSERGQLSRVLALLKLRRKGRPESRSQPLDL